jgi:hypothetical protein
VKYQAASDIRNILLTLIVLIIGCDSGTNSSISATTSSDYGSSNIAITGTVVSVDSTSGSIVISTSSGDIIVDTTSGGTAFLEVTNSAVSATTAVVGNYVGALGSLSGNTLEAIDVAFVPVPPANLVSNSDLETSYVESLTGGYVYAGKITAVSGTILTISTSEGNKEIDTTNATTVTLTSTKSINDITAGDTVTVNGPEVSSTEYTGHMIIMGSVSPPVFLPSMF